MQTSASTPEQALATEASGRAPAVASEATVRAAPEQQPLLSVQARIHHVRRGMRISQEGLAQRLTTRVLHVSAREVAEWESAARRPSAEQFEALAKLAQVSVEWLKTGRDLPAYRRR